MRLPPQCLTLNSLCLNWSALVLFSITVESCSIRRKETFLVDNKKISEQRRNVLDILGVADPIGIKIALTPRLLRNFSLLCFGIMIFFLCTLITFLFVTLACTGTVPGIKKGAGINS